LREKDRIDEPVHTGVEENDAERNDFQKRTFQSVVFFCTPQPGKKMNKEGKRKKEFSFQIFYRRMDRGYLSCETGVRKPKQLRKHQPKKKRVKKSKLESSFLSNYVCAGLRVGWNVISRSKKRPRSLPNALRCYTVCVAGCLFLKKDFQV
jgi:hypothetical protein